MRIICYTILLLPLIVAHIASALPTDIELSINPVDAVEDLELNNIDFKRDKRAGSFNFVGAITNSITSSLGKASASIASGSSSQSAGGSSGHSSQSNHVDVSHFDGWQLKKSILNTILQAVKAITGGFTAINGQLIKGSGYLISAGGRLVAVSGDAVTNAGKKLALSAKLVEPSHSTSSFQSHFAKLSGGSSSASSSSSSSSGSAGSSSPDSHHGTTAVHGESFTSYESPHTATGHINYGPPEHHPSPPLSAPSGPSGHGSAAVHIAVPTYLPASYDQGGYSNAPSSHSSHDGNNYQTPLTSYGTPAGGSPGTSYLTGPVQKNKVTSTISDLYPPLNGLINTKTQALNNAADALRDIINKIPISDHSFDHGEPAEKPHELHHQDNQHYTDNHDINVDIKQVHQYEIPPDPIIPPFQPLKQLLPSYGVGPVEQITHTQQITTAYGAPFSDFQKPIPLVDVDIKQWVDTPIGPGVSQQSAHASPLDMYHTMTLKFAKNQYLPPQPPHAFRPPPPSHSVHHTSLHNDNYYAASHPSRRKISPPNKNEISREQIQNLQKQLGPDFEVQKSVSYELKDPATANRRLIRIKKH